MTRKRVVLIISLMIAAAGLLLFWDNMLIWDDRHGSHKLNNTYSGENAPKNPDTSNPPDAPYTAPGKNTDSSNESSSGNKYHVHINLDEYLIYVFEDKVLIREYPCSGGKSNTPSPQGTWRIVEKDNWGEGFGGYWMGLNVPFGTYGIHGTVFPWIIGKSNASKGCIRMLTKDAEELYNLVPIGTSVTIVQKSLPFRIIFAGDVGSDVMIVQSSLYKLGYYKEKIDGIFGNNLEIAVTEFQKDNHLNQTGGVDKKTYDMILQKAKEF